MSLIERASRLLPQQGGILPVRPTPTVDREPLRSGRPPPPAPRPHARTGSDADEPRMATVFTDRRQHPRMLSDIEIGTPAPRTSSAPPVTIDFAALEEAGYGVPNGGRSPLAEHFAAIKRPLLTNARSASPVAQRLPLIMVTSALPREGKTYCAIQLALSMALEIDTSVLLVDADVVRPEAMTRLGVDAGPGLLDLLTDHRLQLDDVVRSTNVPKLSLLSAGTRNAMSSELLASDAMEALLLTMARTRPKHVIIFDTPPLLVTTEAKVLAARMGQVVMVVAAASTPRAALVDAYKTVESCPIVLSVLNKTRSPATPLYYGYARPPAQSV